MTRRTLALLLPLFCCLLSTSAAVGAAGPRDSLVVTADWLAQHLNDPGLVILQVGEKESYDSGHIPGAQFIVMDDLSIPMDHAAMKPTDLMLEMPDASRLRESLQQFGISDASRIVVYYSDEWLSPSTRVIYALDYAGLFFGELSRAAARAERQRGGQDQLHSPSHAGRQASPGKYTGIWVRHLRLSADWKPFLQPRLHRRRLAQLCRQ